jgi:hypothetical protein
VLLTAATTLSPSADFTTTKVHLPFRFSARCSLKPMCSLETPRPSPSSSPGSAAKAELTLSLLPSIETMSSDSVEGATQVAV